MIDADLAFRVLNALVLPWWLLWLAAPGSHWARRAASHGGVFAALALVYAGLLCAAVASGRSSGAFSGQLDFEGLRAGLSTPLGFLAGWTHYLAFDLFVGAWIVRESARLRVEPRVYLFFALMAGPVGLGGFLVRRWWRLRSWSQLGEPDLV